LSELEALLFGFRADSPPASSPPLEQTTFKKRYFLKKIQHHKAELKTSKIG